jgi:hypothetical protein
MQFRDILERVWMQLIFIYLLKFIVKKSFNEILGHWESVQIWINKIFSRDFEYF